MTHPPVTGSAKIDLAATVAGCELKMSVTVPAGPTRLDDLIPLLQVVSDRMVAVAENESHEQGRCISCSKGCGACCRQLVPISPVEARHVARLVQEMPEPRRSEIYSRFAAARRRLEESGIWQQLNQRQDWPEEDVTDVGLEYFRLGIPCPFLEDESCSIHRDRPLTCREYLVTSPAENCSNPTAQSIEWVPMPVKVWVAAARCEPGASGAKYLNWVPLIQSLDWVASHPEPPAEKNGPDLLKQVLEGLARSGNTQLSSSPVNSIPLSSLERQHAE